MADKPEDFDPYSTEVTDYHRAVADEAVERTYQRFLFANRVQYVALTVLAVALGGAGLILWLTGSL